MKRDKKEDMNKKSTSEATRVKSKKLKLNKQTQRDQTLRGQKVDSVKGGFAGQQLGAVMGVNMI